MSLNRGWMKMRFETGKEYKTIKKNMEIGTRTFTVIRVSHKNMAVEVRGAINGIYKMSINNQGNEMILLGVGDRNYCNPMATDEIN